MNRLLGTVAVWAAALLAGCSASLQHKVEPIHITLDVNLKIDRELHDFYSFESEIDEDEHAPEPDDAGAEGGPST